MFITNLKKLQFSVNSLSANPQKWSHTQTIRRLLPTNCVSVFDQFVGLGLEGLNVVQYIEALLMHCSKFISAHLNCV